MIAKERLIRYAELIVRCGLNPSPGQEIILTADVEQAAFARIVVEECYRSGSGRVFVNWSDMPLEKLAQQHCNEAELSHLAPWETARWQWMTEKFPCRLWIDSDDPDGMSGIDADKHARTLASRLHEIKPFRDAIENRHQWCIAAAPGAAWAHKVFPELPAEEAIDALWEAILAASRANGDPLENWRRHNKEIHLLSDKLNALNLAALEYKSSNGTDFRVGLMKEGLFAGAAECDLAGRVYNPNIPSEEIFTSPKRGEAEGVLVATKPLSYQGNLIEDFSIRFEQGRAVEVRARKGQPVLERMISMDESAACLGECALIPCDSPINNSGVLFFNTLFDENACCHVALGRGFECCVRDYGSYTQQQLREIGLNDSTIHVDFMIGSPDLEITGITADGRRVPVFRRGNWAEELLG